MRLINLTPHEVVLLRGKRVLKKFSSEGVARCILNQTPVGKTAGVTVYYISYGNVISLPDPQKGVKYIVSTMVAHAASDRRDLLTPNEIVRNEHGVIIGCKSFGITWMED